VKTKLFIALFTLALFLAAAALGQEPKPGYGKDTEGKPHLLLCKKTKPKWQKRP